MTRLTASPRSPKSTSADAVNGAKATAAPIVRALRFLIFFIFISSLMFRSALFISEIQTVKLYSLLTDYAVSSFPIFLFCFLLLKCPPFLVFHAKRAHLGYTVIVVLDTLGLIYLRDQASC